MATIRFTRELLEYALDLPEDVSLLGDIHLTEVDGVDCYVVRTEGGNESVPEQGTFALQYEDTEGGGIQLVSALPIEE